MLGSAVSSRTPTDLQPSSVIGCSDRPAMKRQGPTGLPCGLPYPAVGMHSASHSEIGLPSRSSSAAWMVGFWMPAEVSNSFREPPMGMEEGRVGQAAPAPPAESSAPEPGADQYSPLITK